MKMSVINKEISIENIPIIGVSSSSVFQVGSNKSIDTESRYKHIRQLLHDKVPKANP
jgi:hypothetical protein